MDVEATPVAVVPVVTQTVTNTVTHTREHGFTAHEADTRAAPVPMHLHAQRRFDDDGCGGNWDGLTCGALWEPCCGLVCAPGVFNCGRPLWRPLNGDSVRQDPCSGVFNFYAQQHPMLVACPLVCPFVCMSAFETAAKLEFIGLPRGSVPIKGDEKAFLLDRLWGDWETSLESGFGNKKALGANVYKSDIFRTCTLELEPGLSRPGHTLCPFAAQSAPSAHDAHRSCVRARVRTEDEYYARGVKYTPLEGSRSVMGGEQIMLSFIAWRGERMRMSGAGHAPQTQKCSLYRAPDGKLHIDNIGSAIVGIVWVDGKEAELQLVNALGYRFYVKRKGMQSITAMHPYVRDTVTQMQTVTTAVGYVPVAPAAMERA